MESKQSRGRPKKVDETAVHQAVLNQFWEKGYAGTSLSDLSKAARISRPSLYELFGDKQAMYLASLDTVEAQLSTALAATLSGGASIAEELTNFFDTAIMLYVSGLEPRGCLIMCTAPAEAVSDGAIRTHLASVIGQLDTAFARRFDGAQTNGEIPSAPAPAVLAHIATAMLQSIALRARSGTDASELRIMAREMIGLLTAPNQAG